MKLILYKIISLSCFIAVFTMATNCSYFSVKKRVVSSENGNPFYLLNYGYTKKTDRENNERWQNDSLLFKIEAEDDGSTKLHVQHIRYDEANKESHNVVLVNSDVWDSYKVRLKNFEDVLSKKKFKKKDEVYLDYLEIINQFLTATNNKHPYQIIDVKKDGQEDHDLDDMLDFITNNF